MTVAGCNTTPVPVIAETATPVSSPPDTPTPRPTSTLLPTETAFPSQVPEATNSNNKLNIGLFAGDAAETKKLIDEIGVAPDMLATFIGLDGSGDIHQEMVDLAKKNKTGLVIYLETNETNSQMLDTETNEWLTKIAEKLEESEVPTIVVFLPEPNLRGEDIPWADGTADNSPEKFKKVWAMAHEIFKDKKNIKLALALNEIQSGDNSTAYIPPADQVDIYGVDAFRWPDDPRTTEDMFTSTLDLFAKTGKPMCVFSTATSTDKAKWYQEALDYAKKQKLHCVMFFNVKKENDWTAPKEILRDALN